jgi:hypothetical protein
MAAEAAQNLRVAICSHPWNGLWTIGLYELQAQPWFFPSIELGVVSFYERQRREFIRDTSFSQIEKWSL